MKKMAFSPTCIIPQIKFKRQNQHAILHILTRFHVLESGVVPRRRRKKAASIRRPGAFNLSTRSTPRHPIGRAPCSPWGPNAGRLAPATETPHNTTEPKDRIMGGGAYTEGFDLATRQSQTNCFSFSISPSTQNNVEISLRYSSCTKWKEYFPPRLSPPHLKSIPIFGLPSENPIYIYNTGALPFAQKTP